MVAAKDLAVGEKWTRYPRSLEGTGQRAGAGVLGDLFTIKRGLARGPTGFSSGSGGGPWPRKSRANDCGPSCPARACSPKRSLKRGPMVIRGPNPRWP
jgi:hypothetical protein